VNTRARRARRVVGGVKRIGALARHRQRPPDDEQPTTEGLRAHGVAVSGRIPLVTPANRHNAAHLLTKYRRSGHPLALGEAIAAHAGSEQVTRSHSTPANLTIGGMPNR